LKSGKTGISRSNLITTIIVGGFVILVIAGLVISFLPAPSNSTTNRTQALYFSQISLISGSASSNSLNTTCKGDSQLEIYVTNSSPETIYLTNVTMVSSSLNMNGTTLVPLNNGCIPVSEDNPAIQGGSNDLEIVTYPSLNVQPYTRWNVTASFSNGQRISQLSLSSPLS
jgi:hypothetical protein